MSDKEMDEQPVRDTKKLPRWQSGTTDPKKSFHMMNKDLRGTKPKDPVKYEDLPKDLKKQYTAHE